MLNSQKKKLPKAPKSQSRFIAFVCLTFHVFVSLLFCFAGNFLSSILMLLTEGAADEIIRSSFSVQSIFMYAPARLPLYGAAILPGGIAAARLYFRLCREKGIRPMSGKNSPKQGNAAYAEGEPPDEQLPPPLPASPSMDLQSELRESGRLKTLAVKCLRALSGKIIMRPEEPYDSAYDTTRKETE